VKLLFDENLSRRLVPRLSDLFPGSTHLAEQGLLRSSDRAIWNYAKEHAFALVTADADFYELAITLGAPPKVIWLRGCDYPTATAAELIRSQSIRIAEFLEDANRSILILKP
jgi:predicted nuclease of predicted toxin-antitoxin system